MAYDEARTQFLVSLGWRILRFWNSQIRDNPDGVAEAIVYALGARPGESTLMPCL